MDGIDEYYVWCPENGDTIDDAVLIGAAGVEDAAEQWVERHERRACEYSVAAGRESLTVRVRPESRDEVTIVDVEGVPTPTYLGRARS